MYKLSAVVSLIFLNNFKISLACNGYTIQKQSFKNCVDNSIVKIITSGNEALSYTLDTSCNLIMNGCVEITKPFKTAKGTYHIKKLPLPPVEGDMDFCDMAAGNENSKIKKVTDLYGMPSKCPIPARKVCGGVDKKIGLGDFKNQLGLAAGESKAKIEIEHDVGKSCIEFAVTVGRTKRG